MNLYGRGVVCMCGSVPRIPSSVFQLQPARQPSSRGLGFLIKAGDWPGKPYCEDGLSAIDICLLTGCVSTSAGTQAALPVLEEGR